MMKKQRLAWVFSVWLIAFVCACQSQGEREFYQYKTAGKDLYSIHCESCHGKNGEGLGMLVPPLTDSVFLKANQTKIACIIKNGMKDSVVIHGKIYHEKMPAFKQLAAIDIAKITVYITNTFGNNLGMYPYQQTEKDLQNCQ